MLSTLRLRNQFIAKFLMPARTWRAESMRTRQRSSVSFTTAFGLFPPCSAGSRCCPSRTQCFLYWVRHRTAFNRDPTGSAWGRSAERAPRWVAAKQKPQIQAARSIVLDPPVATLPFGQLGRMRSITPDTGDAIGHFGRGVVFPSGCSRQWTHLFDAGPTEMFIQQGCRDQSAVFDAVLCTFASLR